MGKVMNDESLYRALSALAPVCPGVVMKRNALPDRAGDKEHDLDGYSAQ